MRSYAERLPWPRRATIPRASGAARFLDSRRSPQPGPLSWSSSRLHPRASSPTASIDDGPPYTAAITKAARTWRFRPAREDGAAVFGKALVVGVFRPPVLMGSDLPKPTHVQEISEDLPYPTTTATPVYPPTALYEGIAFVEVEIDEDVLQTAEEAYDALALEAVEKFRFRPARRNGIAVTSYALVFFGFRQPHTSKRPRR